MNCTVQNCPQPTVITSPVPLCLRHGLESASACIEAAAASVTPMPEPSPAEAEVAALYNLIDNEGWNTVNLKRAMAVLEKPERTAARRLAEARHQYAALIKQRMGEADDADVRGTEAKRQQNEDATFEAAVLLTAGTAPIRRDFAAGYGRGETWGRDRYADAERLLDEDTEFAARARAEAERRAIAVQVANGA